MDRVITAPSQVSYARHLVPEQVCINPCYHDRSRAGSDLVMACLSTTCHTVIIKRACRLVTFARDNIPVLSLIVKALQLMWRSGTRRWYLRVPNLQMNCSDFTCPVTDNTDIFTHLNFQTFYLPRWSYFCKQSHSVFLQILGIKNQVIEWRSLFSASRHICC